MLFLCFNIHDRESIAEQILYHLSSFGFHVWYDRKDIFLGENRYQKNLIEGAGNSNNNYSVVILSKNFDSGDYCKKELSIIRERFLSKSMYVFPILYDITPEEIPSGYQWILDLVCKIVTKDQDKIYAAYHIVAKITTDLLVSSKYRNFYAFLSLNTDLKFISEIIKNYEALDLNNYSARMSLLYAIYSYLKSVNNIIALPPYYYKGFEKLYSFTRLNLKTDHREMQILENLTLLLLTNYY